MGGVMLALAAATTLTATAVGAPVQRPEANVTPDSGPAAATAADDCNDASFATWVTAVSTALNVYAPDRADALSGLRDCPVPAILVAPVGSLLLLPGPVRLIDDAVSILLRTPSKLATRYLFRYVQSGWAEPTRATEILRLLAAREDPETLARIRYLAKNAPSRDIRLAARRAMPEAAPASADERDDVAMILRRAAAGLLGSTALTAFGSLSRDRDYAAMPVGAVVGLVAGVAGNAWLEKEAASPRRPWSLVASARRLEYSLWGIGLGTWGAIATMEQLEDRRDISGRMEKTVLGALVGNLTGYVAGLADQGVYPAEMEAFVETGFVAGLLTGLGSGLLLDDPSPVGFWGLDAGATFVGGAMGRWLGPRIDYQRNDIATLLSVPLWTTLLGPQLVVATGADPSGREYAGLSLVGLGLGSAAALAVAHGRNDSADRMLTTDAFSIEGVLALGSFHAVVDNRLPRIANLDRQEKAIGIVAAAIVGGIPGFALADRIELDGAGGMTVSLSSLFGAANGWGWYDAVNAREERKGRRRAGSAGLGFVAGSAAGLGVGMLVRPDIVSQGAIATTTLLATGTGLLGGLVADADRLAPGAVIAMDLGLLGGTGLLALGLEPHAMLWMPVGGIVGGGTFALIAFAATNEPKTISAAGLGGLVGGGVAATLGAALRRGEDKERAPGMGRLRRRGAAPPLLTLLDASYVDRRPLLGAQAIWTF